MRLLMKYFILGSVLLQQGLAAEDLTLECAIQRALQGAPAVRVSEVEVDIREAEVIQAGLGPNPSFVFGYNSPQVGLDVEGETHEISYGISQVFEMGGKRCARVQLASSNQDVSDWELEAVKYDLRLKVTEAFLNAVAAQEKVQLAIEHKAVAEEMVQTVHDQVSSGKQSPIQEQKAQILLANREIALQRYLRDLTLAKQRLALLWGCEAPDFCGLCYPFFELSMPEFTCVDQELMNHPQIVKWDYEIAAARSAIGLELAQRVPDVTVTAGLEHQEHINHPSVFLELSVPLPFCNRNQGNIAKADHLMYLAEEKKYAAWLDLQQEFRSAQIEMESGYDQAEIFYHEIINRAKSTFEMIKEGFEEGKFSYLEVLEAQKTLYENQEDFIDLLGEFHIRKSRVLNFITSECLGGLCE